MGDEQLVDLLKIIESGFAEINDLRAAVDAIGSSFTNWKPDYEDSQDCIYNAHSPYLRCAVNPAGTCASCRHYQFDDFKK